MAKKKSKKKKYYGRSFWHRLEKWQLAEILGIVFGLIIGGILTTVSILPYFETHVVLKIIGFILMLPLVIPYSVVLLIPSCGDWCSVIYFAMGVLIYGFIGALIGPLIFGFIRRYKGKYMLK